VVVFMFLGIDVGGANTKLATADGRVESLYAPLWRDKERLFEVLAAAKRKYGSELEAVGAVMTGELSDCFDSRREGVLYIKEALASTFNSVLFFDLTGTFQDASAVDRDPLAFAASNWLASATLVAELYPDAIFVDIGSTTTDVIPIVGGQIQARKTDLGRLQTGELLYSGILRTNIAALLRTVELDGGDASYGIASELFAITADAYLVLGDISEAEYSCSSPNSYAFLGREAKEKSRESALRRLARVVCSDLEELGERGAVRIAAQVKRAQVDVLAGSLARMKAEYGLETIVAAGIGDFIVREAAEVLDLHPVFLSAVYSKELAATFPAYAVAKLVERWSVA
jgi:probable H4MPT-linked C1 transfer pathway protein